MPMESWSPASWRRKPIEQVPDFADQAALAEVERQLAGPAASPGTCSPTPARPALKSSSTLRSALLSAIVLFGPAAPFCDVAHAHHPVSNSSVHKETSVAVVPGADQPSITSIIPALGDFKTGLLDRGINFHLSYIQDTFGTRMGGVKQAAAYGSVLYMAVDADLAKLAGLPGATFRVNAYQKAAIFRPTIFSIMRRSAVWRRGFSSFGSNKSFSPTWRRSASVN